MALDTVVLASASETRSSILDRAGIAFEVMPPRIDEDSIKCALIDDGADGAAIAEALAARKADSISRTLPERLVIGADQVLLSDGELFNKPADLAAARHQLKRLSGRRHELISGLSVSHDGTQLWHYVDSATLHMRRLSDAFIDIYLEATGEAALSGPGAYRVEGPGAQLFIRIDGDHFTVLGLPLLPLLAFLRERGVVMS